LKDKVRKFISLLKTKDMHPTKKSASYSMTGIQKALAMKKAKEMQHEIDEMQMKLAIKKSMGY